MNSKRPVHLALQTMKFPVMAIVSILHRASGLFLFLALPFLLWVLQKSLQSFGEFVDVQQILSAPALKFFIFITMAALFYHLIAGIRHLLMDMRIGESLKSGRRGAQTVLGIVAVVVLLVGAWLW
jgi:succinate dehydrogenase / fumarate reductase cytochrome b subunit